MRNAWLYGSICAVVGVALYVLVSDSADARESKPVPAMAIRKVQIGASKRTSTPSDLPARETEAHAVDRAAIPSDHSLATQHRRVSIAGAPETYRVAGMSDVDSTKQAAVIDAHLRSRQDEIARLREAQRERHRRWRELKRSGVHVKPDDVSIVVQSR